MTKLTREQIYKLAEELHLFQSCINDVDLEALEAFADKINAAYRDEVLEEAADSLRGINIVANRGYYSAIEQSALELAQKHIRSLKGKTMSMQWKNVQADGPPATEPLKQVKVLMYSEGWGIPIMGMFSYHCCHCGSWYEYSSGNDRYVDCDYLPEYYCILTLPNGELA